MKKVLKVIGVLVALVLLWVGSVVYKIVSLQKSMEPSPTGVYNEEVMIIHDDYVNMYLIKGQSGYIAIDAGVNTENVKVQLDKLGVNPKEVKNIVLTHSDMDHVKSIELFEGAKIYLPHDEEVMVNGDVARVFGVVKNKLEVEYDVVNNKEVFSVDGLDFFPLTLAGHTPGSTAYFVHDKYLFTGDIISFVGNKVYHFTDFFNMDTEENKRTYPKLKEYINYDVVFTGHHGYRNREDLVWE